jgi:hypothetical protein
MTAPTSAHSPAPINVFISYSHKDDDLRAELDVHLSNLKRQGKIAAWHDRAIEAGMEWEDQIKTKLESAPVILLLISPPFMASNYCYDIEMERAIERHKEGTTRVIPIILRPCDWQGSPFSKLQVLPKEGKPVTLWVDRDSAFLDVVQGIRQALESFSKQEKNEQQREWTESMLITGMPTKQFNNEVSLNPMNIIKDNIKAKKNNWLKMSGVVFVVLSALVTIITYVGKREYYSLSVVSPKCYRYQDLKNLPENKKSCVYLLAEEEKSKMFDQFREELEKKGFNVVNQKRMYDDTRPSYPEIRYFHGIDKQRAEIIEKIVKPHFPSQKVEAKLCQSNPSLREGYIELWLGKSEQMQDKDKSKC